MDMLLLLRVVRFKVNRESRLICMICGRCYSVGLGTGNEFQSRLGCVCWEQCSKGDKLLMTPQTIFIKKKKKRTIEVGSMTDIIAF